MHTTLAFEGASSLSAGNLTLVAGDIIAILTGETDKNNLSAMTSPGGTSIASTYPAGWTVWDAATGVTDEWILRAPCDGDATQYKYVRLTFVISMATYLGINWSLMEDWDVGSNTPTNETTPHLARFDRYPTNSYGPNNTLEIMATNRYIMFRVNLYDFGFGIACLELSRIHPCYEVGSGYLPACCGIYASVQTNHFIATNLTTYYARIPRIIDDAGTADITDQLCRITSGGIRAMTNVSNEFDQLSEDVAYDNSAVTYYGVHNIIVERRDLIGQICGDSSVADIFISQGGTLAGFEDRTLHTLDTNDDTRCMWKNTSDILTHGNMRYMIPAE